MCVSRSRKGRAWACLARLGATTLPPPLALVVLRAPSCGHPNTAVIRMMSDCKSCCGANSFLFQQPFKLGKIPEAVPVATAIILTSTTLAHERGGMCVERHVSWIGTGTGTADLCYAPPHRLFYTGFPRSTGCACQLCLSITSF